MTFNTGKNTSKSMTSDRKGIEDFLSKNNDDYVVYSPS
jgi:hypothetical protein